MLRATYSLNGHSYAKGATKMRVFCPEHKRGFFAPRQNPIKCENRAHVLGELDFEGTAKPSFDLQWQYCCNCEHFCPIESVQEGLGRCPVCTRRSSALYMCDRCYTISFESDTPIQSKNFTLTAEGAPHPSCPACLQANTADLREHSCDELGVTFITPLNKCPICRERLDVGPSFPAALAHYLKRTKATNKLNVTFDYESGLFVPVEDGEFVVVNHDDLGIEALVLPRAVNFASRRDFYEYYQDYYHCAAPESGDVHIIEPAVVTRVGDGWRFRTNGILEVVSDRPMQKSPTPAKPPSPPPAKTETRSKLVSCAHCGAEIEGRYAYCWKCGNSLTQKSEPAERAAGDNHLLEADPDDEELTVQHEGHAPKSMFAWAASKTPKRSHSGRSVLKLGLIAVVGLGLVLVAVFALTSLFSRVAPATAATAGDTTTPTASSAAKGSEQSGSTGSPAPTLPTAAVMNAPDDELKQLREKRVVAKASDRTAILGSFARVEKRYPADYRFPYERAKFVSNGLQSTSWAFAILSKAADKAISAGKAREMLERLEADKTGDFRKLSAERREWTQLQETLKRNGSRVLNARLGM